MAKKAKKPKGWRKFDRLAKGLTQVDKAKRIKKRKKK